MYINNKKALVLIVMALHLLLNYGWLIYNQGNPRMLTIGGDIFQIAAPCITSYIILKESWKRDGKDRLFWFLIGAANLCYFLAQFAWNMDEWFLNIEPPAFGASDCFWGAEILLLFSAMGLKMFQITSQKKTVKMVFDILIVMVVAATLTWEFLLKPNWPVYVKEDWLSVLTFAFTPIGDLGLLFGALTITYTAERVKTGSLSLLFTLGILALVIADSYYMFLGLSNMYATGNLIDPVWSISLFFIALSAVYSPVTEKEPEQEEDSGLDVYVEEKPLSEYFYLVLPYIAVGFLFSIMLTRVRLDAIFIGLTASIALIILRQILTLLENEDILKRYRKLTQELDEKVRERTRELEYIAYHDQLTGLPNRRLFEGLLNESIEKARETNTELAVLLLDLDRFKQINDVMGHSMGDLLLVRMAERLRLCLQPKGEVFRLGGDEFIIILPYIHLGEVKAMAEKIKAVINRPLKLEKEEVGLSTSIGISLFPYHGEDSATLMKQADVAMYQAKETGKNAYQVFTNDMKNRVSKQMLIEKGMADALKTDGFQLVFQPLVKTENRRVIGTEALLRWEHPQLGPIPPLEFIPIAEETGTIADIGYWVLKEACRHAVIWHEKEQKLYMSINLSVTQFKQGDFVDRVEEILITTRMPREFLILEITESVAILDAQMVYETLERLRALGIKIAIDDFGTGYSSLNYLNKYPISILKIDKSFVDHIDESMEDRQIVSAIIGLAETLKASVIAEGVETPSQLAALESLGCRNAQGYLFSKPLKAADFQMYLKENQPKLMV